MLPPGEFQTKFNLIPWIPLKYVNQLGLAVWPVITNTYLHIYSRL